MSGEYGERDVIFRSSSTIFEETKLFSSLRLFVFSHNFFWILFNWPSIDVDRIEQQQF